VGEDVVAYSGGTAAFANKNVANGTTVTAIGLSLTGADAGNYTVNATATASANITKAPLTITAATDSKVYDATTSAAATPTVAGLQGTDTVTALSETYDTKHVGASKTLSVATYTVNDGNGGGNYNVSTGTATGSITKASLTISALTNTKVYDGNTTAAAIPTTSGLMGGDTATGLVEVYDNKNVGTGKTLTVSAYTVNDGNSGGNYQVALVASTTGVITKKSATITARPNTKVFDGNVTAVAIPTVSGLIAADSASGLAEAYATPDVGIGKTLNVSAYAINDGNFGGNYNVSTVADNTGSITYASSGSCLGEPGHQILQPINVDGSSVFKQKSTVPAKFRVCDAAGHSIGTAGVVTGFVLYQIVNGTVTSTVNEDVTSTAADQNFRFDPSAQQWIFNIDTKSQSANKTYIYLITLADSTTITFQFGLK